MFRAFLLLAALCAGALLAYQWDAADFDTGAGKPDQSGELVAGGWSQPRLSFMNRPAIRVLSAPQTLERGEPGTVTVQAESPAAPGDPVRLETAGTYNLGYNLVSAGLLDDQLRATLDVTAREYLGSFNYWAKIPASGTYQSGKSASFAIKIAAAGPPPAPGCGGENPVKSDGTPWICSYADEFDGAELDRRFWVPQVTATSGFTTGTKGLYACAEDTPETIAVRGGNLELSLIELAEPRNCGKRKSSRYMFGQVMHFQTFSQTYGKYEVRARIPEVEVPGVQQSFWLWPVKNRYGYWPASGEIDFAEMYSNTPGLDRPYIHYLPGETEGGTNKNVTHAVCPLKVGGFNTYGLEWEPGRLTVLLNGEVCFVNDYSSAARFQGRYSPFDKPFFLSLNQALGSYGNSPEPGTLPAKVTTQVDYVRIWR